jgi:hypothetical protein
MSTNKISNSSPLYNGIKEWGRGVIPVFAIDTSEEFWNGVSGERGENVTQFLPFSLSTMEKMVRITKTFQHSCYWLCGVFWRWQKSNIFLMSGDGILYILAGSPFFERKSSKKQNVPAIVQSFICSEDYSCVNIFYSLPHPSPSKPSMRPRLSTEGSNTK